MLILTAKLRDALEAALLQELEYAEDSSLHGAVAARRADLRDLEELKDGDEVTGDLLDSAGYLGYIDL